MSAVATEHSTVQVKGASKPDIMVWFDWAGRLTTGLGTKAYWDAKDQNNFDVVLLSLVASLHRKPGEHLPEHLYAELDNTGIKPPYKLVAGAGSLLALETITRFMLEQLALRDSKDDVIRAFKLAEDLRVVSGNTIFGAQLQLFQMDLLSRVSPDIAMLEKIEREPWDDRAVLVAKVKGRAITEETAGPVYAGAKRFMDNFLKSSATASLKAA